MAFSFSACTKQSASTAPAGSVNALVSRGRTQYQANCIACHNSDPKKAGAVGPEVFGASKELLEARIMRAEYPTGYTPKRQTHAMVALPHLKNEIEALHAFLNQ